MAAVAVEVVLVEPMVPVVEMIVVVVSVVVEAV